jgi:hypothetical protein
MGRLLALKQDGGTPAIEQMIVADFFGAHFDEHVTTLKAGVVATVVTRPPPACSRRSQTTHCPRLNREGAPSRRTYALCRAAGLGCGPGR